MLHVFEYILLIFKAKKKKDLGKHECIAYKYFTLTCVNLLYCFDLSIITCLFGKQIYKQQKNIKTELIHPSSN